MNDNIKKSYWLMKTLHAHSNHTTNQTNAFDRSTCQRKCKWPVLRSRMEKGNVQSDNTRGPPIVNERVWITKSEAAVAKVTSYAQGTVHICRLLDPYEFRPSIFQCCGGRVTLVTKTVWSPNYASTPFIIFSPYQSVNLGSASVSGLVGVRDSLPKFTGIATIDFCVSLGVSWHVILFTVPSN